MQTRFFPFSVFVLIQKNSLRDCFQLEAERVLNFSLCHRVPSLSSATIIRSLPNPEPSFNKDPGPIVSPFNGSELSRMFLLTQSAHF